MRRHELTDEHWALVEPIVPRNAARTGRPARDRRIVLNGIFWIVHTGAPWRDLPERFGPWQTVYHHFARWRRRGMREWRWTTAPLNHDSTNPVPRKLLRLRHSQALRRLGTG